MPRRRNEKSAGETRIGISGWRYKPWRGTFYPADLTQKSELAFASRQFNSIEINGSFYSLQQAASWKRWYDETPAGFMFSVKGSRYITHMRRLKDVAAPLANFFAQGVLMLEEKLGPILWQFPPSFQFDAERIEHFFKQLPRDTAEAAKLAKGHDERMKGRTHTKVKRSRELRYAMEIRHDSFKSPEFISLLRKYNVALVVADTAGKWPLLEDVTADFVYVRLHGDAELYVSGYTPAALDHWTKRVTAWRRGGEVTDAIHASTTKPAKLSRRDIFVYFDNDAKVKAPFDAMNLAKRVGGYVPESPARLPDKLAGEEARQHWPSLRTPKSK